MADEIRFRPLLTGELENGDIDWPFTFPLRKPIKAFEDEYAAITMQEPTASHAIKHGLLNGLADERVVPLVSELTAIPEASLLKMTASDILKLTNILARFFVQAAR